MKYFKSVTDGYIRGLGTHYGAIPIPQEEYDRILTAIRNKPEPDPGYDYFLKDDGLTWDLIELPPQPDPPEDVDDAEALAAIEEALA